MKFKNETDETILVRKEDSRENTGYRWVHVRPGQSVNLPKEAGHNYGLTYARDADAPEPSHGTDHEAKEEPQEDFMSKLTAIHGIGKKTAQDIMEVYPSEEELKRDIHNGAHLPFWENVSEALREHYG